MSASMRLARCGAVLDIGFSCSHAKVGTHEVVITKMCSNQTARPGKLHDISVEWHPALLELDVASGLC